jgi:excisionase family DNA binding protein
MPGTHTYEKNRSGTAPSAPRYFTISDVADSLSVSNRTVRRWIDRRLLIAHRIGGTLRIAEADLKAFLALHREG